MNNNFILNIINKDIKENKFTKIRTRFPPEPSGYLHIGHAKSIFINFKIAFIYNGKCNLRFDDTNPSKIKIKYINSIIKDINWLGFKNKYKITYSSDYFNEIYKFAIKLIKKNLAYIDELSINEIRNYRGTLKKIGINSPYRNRSIQENLNLFIKMKEGYFNENKMCLRIKLNMKSNNIIMRDPIIYRIKFDKHIITKNLWCIYPTYDFSHCICDYLENITHSLCTSEFKNNNNIYKWILNNIDIDINKLPKQYEFSKLNLEYNILSKRKIKFLVKNNIVNGWSDPRLLTISGLKNRGYTPESIINFCNIIGISNQESNIKLNTLENCIKSELNITSYRIMSVINPIKIIIDNLENNYEENIIAPDFPNNNNTSYRYLFFNKYLLIDKFDFCECNEIKCDKFSIGKFAKLRYSYIIYAKKIFIDKFNNKNIICIVYKNTLNSIYLNNIKINRIIHWVSYNNNIKSKLYIFNNIINYRYPSKIKNILSIVNKKSIFMKNIFVEKSSNKLFLNRRYQFERIGYFYLKYLNYDKKLIIFYQISTFCINNYLYIK